MFYTLKRLLYGYKRKNVTKTFEFWKIKIKTKNDKKKSYKIYEKQNKKLNKVQKISKELKSVLFH